MSAKRSLNFRLQLTVSVVTFVVLTSLSLVSYYFAEIRLKAMIREEVSIVLESLDYSTASDVESKNVHNLNTLIDKLLLDNTFERVEFLDVTGKVITGKEMKKEADDHFTREGDIYSSQKKAKVGTLRIGYNYSEVKILRQEFIIVSIISNILAQIIVAIALHLIMRRSLKKLNESTSTLRVLSEETNASSLSVQKTSEEVSLSSTEQATAIQETVATLEEISSQVSSTVENVLKSTDKAQESLQLASDGKNVVTEMIGSMEAISTSNKEIMEEISRGNERIEGIVKIINEISQKTTVINDIVFQTKLLSFNASVEAARAGEHGKGFAVVAEEVGNLAQMSGKASTEIADILSDSIVKVKGVIEETNRNVKRLVDAGNMKVSTGVQIADRCAKVLDDVVTNAEIVKNMMNEVSVASREQAEGVKNISLAMNQLDQATNHNTKSANQTSLDAKTLSGHSEKLKSTVEVLEEEILGVTKIHQEIKPKIQLTKVVEPPVKKKIDNVIPLESVKPKTAPKVEVKAPPKPEAKPAPTPAPIPLKKQSSDQGVPAHNDPRFEDV